MPETPWYYQHMSERFINETADVRPHLDLVGQKDAYSALVRRGSHEDIDWFVGHPRSVTAHPKGYERDALTPSHHTAMLTKSVAGPYGRLATGTLAAYKSLIIPKDTTEAGMKAFIHDTLSGQPTEVRHYAHVLINEPEGFRRRTKEEETYLFRTEVTGLNLASLAIHHHLSGLHFTELAHEEEADIRAAHKEAQARLGLVRLADADQLKPKYIF